MKVSYTAEAIADLVDIMTYISERSPAGAERLRDRLLDRIGRLAAREFEGPETRLRSGSIVRSWAVPPLRVYYQRNPADFLIVRIYHQARQPIAG